MTYRRTHLLSVSMVLITLTGCMAKDAEFTEQQKRMQRCDQYVDREREDCLKGSPVTIDDYKDDYRAYQRAKEREEKQKEINLLEKGKQKNYNKTKIEDKPTP